MNDEVFAQDGYHVRFEWGAEGVRRLAPLSNVVVIVDVLSFTTCVEVAAARGATVFPYRHKDDSARTYAESVGAILALERGEFPSLSPSSLLSLSPNSRMVLPSPNGSTCTVLAAKLEVTTIAGCLRNAFSVADYIKRNHPNEVISIIACGEQWSNGVLRPALEDLPGAGAILSQFDPSLLSPEARVAASVFDLAKDEVQTLIKECSSGRELTEKGFTRDLSIASELNASKVVPVFHNEAYIQTL